VVAARWPRAVAGALAVAALAGGCGPAYLEPAAAGPDYAIQGEYAAARQELAAQVIARGSGEFELVLLAGGLPGAGWDGRERTVVAGRRVGHRVEFAGGGVSAALAERQLRGRTADGLAFALERVVRQSPTLGAPPPPGATILFDGETNAFDGRVDDRGWLEAGATSRAAFGDFRLHLEFRTPFMPRSRGQARGNSGIYLQERYEIQVLDSFGLEPAPNRCGAIYEFAAPAIEMSLPPLVWQTYDIDFRAARFDDAGARTAPARVTVRHNGVLIHDDVALPGPTGRGEPETPAPRPLTLQDHWNPVVYRNIWLLER
jgi:hypothetical protein